MRILHVVAGPADGRTRALLVDGVAALAETGLEQRMLAPADARQSFERLERAGVVCAHAPFDPVWRAATRKAVADHIARFEPSVIQYWGGRAARFAPPRHKARSMLWHPGYTKHGRIDACRWHSTATPAIAAHVLSLGVDASRVVQWNAFVPAGEASQAERADWQTPENAPVVLCLARLQGKAGVDTLLRAQASLVGVHVWLAEGGPQEAELRALATKLGTAARVRFVGGGEDRAALLACCDVVAVPAREDALGLGVLEGWAATRPVVAARVGGPAAIIEPERDGLLVESEDEAGLAQALRRALEDGELAGRLTSNGARRYEKSYSQMAFTRTALRLYERVDRAARASSKASAAAEPSEA